MGCCASDDRGASKANMDGQKKGTTAGPRPAVFSNRNFATLFVVEHLPSLRFFWNSQIILLRRMKKIDGKILLSDEIWSLPKCLNLNSQRGKMVPDPDTVFFFFNITPRHRLNLNFFIDLPYSSIAFYRPRRSLPLKKPRIVISPSKVFVTTNFFFFIESI